MTDNESQRDDRSMTAAAFVVIALMSCTLGMLLMRIITWLGG